jgi:hypothetical protein
MIRLRTGSLYSRSVLTYSELAASIEGVFRMNKWALSECTTSEVGVFRERVIRLRTDSHCSRNVLNLFELASPCKRNAPKVTNHETGVHLKKWTYQKDKVRLNLQVLKAV